LPSAALPRQHSKGRGTLRPANGVHRENHSQRLLALLRQTAQANNNFHILADRRIAKPSRLDYFRPTEHGECSRDNQRALGQVPARATQQEASEILHHLQSLNPGGWQPHLLDTPMNDLAAVSNTNRSAANDNILYGTHHRLHEAQQSIRLDQTISV